MYYDNEFDDREEPVLVEGVIVKETEAAILLCTDPLGEDIWLPKSQIDYNGGMGDEVTVSMAEWLAEDKGFI